MEESILREIADEYLVPLFSGARLDASSVRSTWGDRLVALHDPCTIYFKAEKSDVYRLVIRRSQPFSQVRGITIAESHVVRAFIDVINEIKDGLNRSYKSDLLSAFQRRVVAKAVGRTTQLQRTMLNTLDQMAVWASRLYEGQPIAAAFGIKFDLTSDAGRIHEICTTDFSAVLSNGFDSLLVFNERGQLLSHESLMPPTSVPAFAPYRQGPIADWATTDQIAVALNRLGELLVFRERQLLFARRSGRWHFLTHEPVITQMGRHAERPVRLSVYETCLDASFARTGACIGIVNRQNFASWMAIAPEVGDHVQTGSSVKAKALKRLINGRLFQTIDRRLRQELVAIDGATILDPSGHILAVGAILNIPGGSAGGGRLAAAKALSTKGVGIKISQDGGIQGFVEGQEEAKFLVM